LGGALSLTCRSSSATWNLRASSWRIETHTRVWSVAQFLSPSGSRLDSSTKRRRARQKLQTPSISAYPKPQSLQLLSMS
jgi:hypothetical protein